jgi:hypothetical protein
VVSTAQLFEPAPGRLDLSEFGGRGDVLGDPGGGGREPGMLDELAAERASLLEKESADLEKQAQRLAAEIEELSGETPVRIG